MPQSQTAPQYLDDNGDPIGAPASAPALTYLDDQGNPTNPMKPKATGDVRSQIAARKANPPATAYGDPNAKHESFLEEAMPALAHPVAATGSFLESVNPFPAMAHPVDTIRADFAARQAAFERLKARGSKLITADPADPQSGEDLRDIYEYLVPGLGPMMANAGRQMNSTDAETRARGFGTAVAATSGPKIVSEAVRAVPVSAIVKKVLNKSDTPTLDAMDANLGNDTIGEPGKPPYDTTPHGDNINRAIGPGASNSQRGLNVGKAFVDAGMEIDPAEIKKNPRALVTHTNKVIAAENTAADQLMKSPDAQKPIANGNLLTGHVGEGVALIDAADARAAKAARSYVDRRISELSAKHSGDGMLSIADTDALKRELQNRANYDKIFGNTSLSSAGNLRNQLLADYARSLDQVGDTLLGYRELNERRASLVNFRDTVLHPIIDTKVNGPSQPSRVGTVARVAGSELLKLNPVGAMSKVAGELMAPRTVVPDPVRIAKAINQQVRAAKAAGFESPATRILSGAQVNEPPAAATPTEVPGSAQFAGSAQGDVFPINRRPGAVASAFQPSGPTSAATPLETPIVRATARSAAQDAQAQSNPGFDPVRLPVKQGGTPPASPPVSHIDLASTLRGVSSAPGELYPSLLDSTRSSAPGQLGELVARAGAAQGLARQLRDAARQRPAGVSAPPLEPLPADLQAALAAQRVTDTATAARRAVAPVNPTPSPNVFPRRPGSAIEFPAKGDRDENDSMLMQRTDASGKPLQFPMPIPASRLLPPQFKNAQAVQWGAPLPGVLDPETRGLYGLDFNSGKMSSNGTSPTTTGQVGTANTVLINRGGTDEPGTYAHEVNHAVYQKDLPPEQKRQFQQAVVDAINAGAKDKAVIATIPKAVIAYANAYPNDHDRAFNEAFAELGAQYMLNPTAFRANYPGWYGMFKQFYGGREYIQAKR